MVATPRTPLNPVLSADGRWAAYTVTAVVTGGETGPGQGFVIETTGGAPLKVCESCQIDLWTRDGRQVVIAEPGRRALIRVDPRTSMRVPLITGSRRVDRPMFGSNGAWVTFNISGSVLLAPVHPDRPATEAEWTTILETSDAERTAGLSPDGSLLYVLLERDGFRCLYAMRIDPGTGRPRGEPFVVAHFHDASLRWGSTGLGSAVATGVFVVFLTETTGNVWMTTLTRTR